MATKANFEMEGGLGVLDHTLTQIRLIGIENNPNCIGLIQRLVLWVLPLKQGTTRQAQGQSHDDESTTSTHDSKKYLQKACRLEKILQKLSVLIKTSAEVCLKFIYFGFVSIN